MGSDFPRMGRVRQSAYEVTGKSRPTRLHALDSSVIDDIQLPLRPLWVRTE